MLNELIALEEILQLRPYRVADFCDGLLTAETLLDELLVGEPFDRKELCDFLGIAESTLSGWLKEGRIPRMAKNAYVLLLVQQQLAEEVRDRRAEVVELRAKDFKVVRAGDHFQVCEFEEDEEGEVCGRVVADQIVTIEDARLLASGHRALRLARETEPAFEHVIDRVDNEAFRAQMRGIQGRLRAHELFLLNHAEWRTNFGKKSCSARLDALFDGLLGPSSDSPDTGVEQPGAVSGSGEVEI